MRRWLGMGILNNAIRSLLFFFGGVLFVPSLVACGAGPDAMMLTAAATAALPPKPTGTLPAVVIMPVTRPSPSATPRPTPCQLPVQPVLSAACSEDEAKVATDLSSKAIEAEIRKNLDLGRALGLTGTPSYVVGNRILSGAVGYDELKAAIEEARKADAA